MNQPLQRDDILTLREAAVLLKVSPQTIGRMVDEGLPCLVLRRGPNGRCMRRILMHELLEFVNGRQQRKRRLPQRYQRGSRLEGTDAVR